MEIGYSVMLSPEQEVYMGLTASTMSLEWSLGDVPNFTFSTDSFKLGDDGMSWNYRVVMEPATENSMFGEDSFTIREVFYDNNGEIEFWSDEGCVPTGNTFQEMADDFDLMAAAFELPVLKIEKDENGMDVLVEIEVEYEYPTEDDEEESDEEETEE